MFGTCVDTSAENHTRSVYEEIYDDVIDYSMSVRIISDNLMITAQSIALFILALGTNWFAVHQK